MRGESRPLMNSIGAVGSLLGASGAHSIGELFKHFHCRIPINASISNRHTLLQCCETTSSWGLLVALIDVRLNHYANNPRLAFTDLIANDLCDLGLVLVVLLRVAYNDEESPLAKAPSSKQSQ